MNFTSVSDLSIFQTASSRSRRTNTFRLSQSPHRDEFVLKGAMLFTVWTGDAHRATWDLDLLGHGVNSLERIAATFRTITSVHADDGVDFDSKTVETSRIKEGADYEGARVNVVATLGQARLRLQIDVGFGDAQKIPASTVEYPSLLGMSAPLVQAYQRETVIAEKFHAMVSLGMANSRMKDYYDVATLAQRFSFDGAALRDAILGTFERRETAIPTTLPLGLSEEFADELARQRQWIAFCRKARVSTGETTLANAVLQVRRFIWPVLNRAHFSGRWPPGGPWP